MPNEAQKIGGLIGNIGGGIIRSIVDGRQLDQQAELAAQMFEGTGHPTGKQIAEVLRDNPETGFQFLQQMGGSSVAYNRILSMQAASREQGAVDAQNQATIRLYGLPPGAPGGAGGTPQDISAQGMPPAAPSGMQGAGWAPPGAPPASNPNVPDPRASGGRIPVQMPSQEEVSGILVDAAAKGADLSAVMRNAKAAREMMMPDPSVASDALSAIVEKAGTGPVDEVKYRALVEEARRARIPVSDLNAALKGRPKAPGQEKQQVPYWIRVAKGYGLDLEQFTPESNAKLKKQIEAGEDFDTSVLVRIDNRLPGDAAHDFRAQKLQEIAQRMEARLRAAGTPQEEIDRQLVELFSATDPFAIRRAFRTGAPPQPPNEPGR